MTLNLKLWNHLTGSGFSYQLSNIDGKYSSFITLLIRVPCWQSWRKCFIRFIYKIASHYIPYYTEGRLCLPWQKNMTRQQVMKRSPNNICHQLCAVTCPASWSGRSCQQEANQADSAQLWSQSSHTHSSKSSFKSDIPVGCNAQWSQQYIWSFIIIFLQEVSIMAPWYYSMAPTLMWMPQLFSCKFQMFGCQHSSLKHDHCTWKSSPVVASSRTCLVFHLKHDVKRLH